MRLERSVDHPMASASATGMPRPRACAAPSRSLQIERIDVAARPFGLQAVRLRCRMLSLLPRGRRDQPVLGRRASADDLRGVGCVIRPPCDESPLRPRRIGLADASPRARPRSRCAQRPQFEAGGSVRALIAHLTSARPDAVRRTIRLQRARARHALPVTHCCPSSVDGLDDVATATSSRAVRRDRPRDHDSRARFWCSASACNREPSPAAAGRGENAEAVRVGEQRPCGHEGHAVLGRDTTPASFPSVEDDRASFDAAGVRCHWSRPRHRGRANEVTNAGCNRGRSRRDLTSRSGPPRPAAAPTASNPYARRRPPARCEAVRESNAADPRIRLRAVRAV